MCRLCFVFSFLFFEAYYYSDRRKYTRVFPSIQDALRVISSVLLLIVFHLGQCSRKKLSLTIPSYFLLSFPAYTGPLPLGRFNDL